MDRNFELRPEPTPGEARELTSIAYLLASLESMRERGLIPPEGYTTVVAETMARRAELERAGQFRAAFETAQRLATTATAQALQWASRARELDPGRQEGWRLEVDLLQRLHRHDEALALGCEAAERFPELEPRLAELRAARQASAQPHPLPQAGVEVATDGIDDVLVQAQAALKREDDQAVIDLCGAWLEHHPDHIDAMVWLAFSLRRVGRREESLQLYRRLASLQPQNSVWSLWVRALESKTSEPHPKSNSKTVAMADSRSPEPESEPSGPVYSWSSVAGEFLEEHWQKLILCLAVLLIVVSSTVGAHLLLGPKLWSPIGKCALALVYTLMFAGFGSGLVRWGAERAGRMMLLTTLIVVPVNFMLAGEMRLLIDPTPFRLAVLAFDVLALFFVTRQVARTLSWRNGANFLAVSLIALSACDAATARGVSFEWGFSAFMIPPWLFLGAVWWLNTRWQTESDQEQEARGFADVALGLLTFAFLSGLLRTAAVMQPMVHPSLFGVPVMLTAIACAHTAHHLARLEKDWRRLQLLRFGGFLLSALAFSFALSRPPEPSSLFSANVLATALLGLVLYAGSLRITRHPAYLYFAFGSLFVGYLGAFYYIADLVHAIEDHARRVLGYPDRLPFAFKSVRGLGLNVFLALLAIQFSRRWKDERLARHCHYIGIPLSIAACLLSTLEAKAGLICMSGYAVLYTVAMRFFHDPRLVYLASASLSGALLFGSILWPGVTLDARVLGTAVLGSAMWALGGFLQGWPGLLAYRRRLIHVVLTLAGLAIVAAGLLVLLPTPGLPPVSVLVTLAFLVAAWLCVLVLADLPYAALVHLAVVGFLGVVLGALGVASGQPIHLSPLFGVGTAALAMALLASAEVLSGKRSIRATVLVANLPNSALLLSLLAIVMSLQASGGSLVPAAAALAMAGGVSLWLTRFRREIPLVYLGIGLVVASQLVLGWGRVTGINSGLALGVLALISVFAALVLWRIGFVVRRAGGHEFYAGPCFHVALVMTVLVYGLAFAARLVSRAAYPASAAALVADGLALILLTTAWRTPGLTYAAVASLVSATYLVLFSVGHSDPAMAYILGLVAVVEGLVFWGVGLFSQRSGQADLTCVYGRPLFVSALGLTLLAIPNSLSSSLAMSLITISFLLMIKSFPAAGWLYAALGSLWCVLDLAVLESLTSEQRILAAVIGTFLLWGLGVVARRRGPGICRSLELPPLALARPFFNVAILAAYLALTLTFMPVVTGTMEWSTHAWVPLSLALFCLLMVEAQPDRGWVHAFALLASTGSLMAVNPWVSSTSGWLLVGMVLALFWLMLGQDFLRLEPRLCRRFSIEALGAGAVLESWSMFGFTVAGGLTGLLVAVATLLSIFFDDTRSTLMARAGWFPAGPALGFAWLYVMARSYRFGDHRPAVHAIIDALLIWWLGHAPWLSRHGVQPADFDAPLTAALSLAIVLAGRRGEVGVDMTAVQAHLIDRVAFVLALIACSFTVADPSSDVMLGTWFLATSTFGILAVDRHRVVSAYAAALSWFAFCGFSVDRFAHPWLISPGAPLAFDFACGLALAVFLLWGASGWLRSTRFGWKSWGAAARGHVVRAWERMAVLGSLWAVAAVLALNWWRGPGSAPLTDAEWRASVGLLMALAGFDVLVARRWSAEWLIYAAQATLLGAYFQYRGAFPVSVSTDAAVLTLFGYLDLGLSEVMQRLRMNRYARPTLYVSLVLPLIPPVMAILDGRFDELSLFLMLTTAAFYGVACYTRQWKSLGYMAAVLLNAILWVAWSRVGWKLTDHPQLFLIPVGLSAILFAEVNRREFGTDVVNAIRGCGLTLVYASLALPIWQFESFGAWLTLLLLSLVGIFAGIGLRIQTFLWLGLVGFVLDVVYQLGRLSSDNVLARWGVMLSLGILLFLFVALNEKKRIVATMRQLYDQARQWE